MSSIEREQEDEELRTSRTRRPASMTQRGEPKVCLDGCVEQSGRARFEAIEYYIACRFGGSFPSPARCVIFSLSLTASHLIHHHQAFVKHLRKSPGSSSLSSCGGVFHSVSRVAAQPFNITHIIRSHYMQPARALALTSCSVCMQAGPYYYHFFSLPLVSLL